MNKYVIDTGFMKAIPLREVQQTNILLNSQPFSFKF